MGRAQAGRDHSDSGFTLIELLVVVIILGILAAIAIPTFLNQRQRAWRSAAQADLRNAVIQLENYSSDNGTYLGMDPDTFSRSEGVTMTFGVQTPSAYCLEVDHANLPGGVDFHFDSSIARPEPGPC